MILLTGANGFIGSALLTHLNRSGISNILACDFVTPQMRPDLLSGSQYALFIDAEELMGQLGDLKIDQILHIGACSSTTETRWDYLEKVNLNFSKRLFAYAAQKKIPFYYASSGAVYGDGQLGFDDRTETENFKPLNLYGKSKADFDIWALQQKDAPPIWCGFRYFNVYGPNEYFKGDMASVIYKAFHQIKSTGQITLFRSHNPKYRDGEQLRDFVYVKDILDWTLHLVKGKSIRSGIYNMGFGQARTWLDVAKALFGSLGVPVQVNWIDVPESIRNQYQYFTCAKMDKLFSEGFEKPKWSVESGVSDYVKNFLLSERPFYR